MKNLLSFFLLVAMLLPNTSAIANIPSFQSDSISFSNFQQVKPLVQIDDTNSIQLFLQINETKLMPDELIYLYWSVEGQNTDWKNNQYNLELCVPAEIKPIGDTEKDFNFDNGCWEKELKEFSGELLFETTNEYFGGMMISGILFNENEKVAENSVDFEVISQEASDQKIELKVGQKAILAKDKTQITTSLRLEGFSSYQSDQPISLEICFSDEIQAVEESNIGTKDDELGCYKMPVEQAEFNLDWKLSKDDSLDSTAIQYYLFEGDDLIGYQIVDIFMEASGFVSNKKESKIEDKSGRMTVSFPEQAATRNLDITIKSELENSKTIVGTPVQLNAFDAESGEEVKQFDGDIMLEISYSGTEVEDDPDRYTWKYFHEGSQIWVNIPTEIDYENKIIHGWTNHFSDFVIDPAQIFISQIPALTTADVSEFTGGASYQIPIQVPQGPGGFTPSISLDYNSQIADNVSSYTQSSIIGLGWDLNTGGVITRNNHSHFLDRDDTFSIKLGNIGYELIPIGKGANYREYVTTNKNFTIIRYYNNSCTGYERIGYWVLWDKSGTKYTFQSADIFDQKDVTCSEYLKNHGYAWHLSEIENQSGQIIKYIYERYDYPGGTRTRESYLEDIVYPDGHTRIHFVNEEGRHDYLWTWWDARIPHSRRSLDQIQIMYDPLIEYSTGGRVIQHGDETIISYYQLNHFDDTNSPIFPLFKWEYEENNKAGTYLALSELVYKGKNEGELSKISFEYGDNMHLTEVNNNNGGKVTFEYESIPWYNVLDQVYSPSTEAVNYDNLGFSLRYIGASNSGGYSLHYPGQIIRVFCYLAEIDGDDTFQLFMSNDYTVGNVDSQNIPTINIGDPNSWSDYLDNDGPYNATVEAYLFWKPELVKAKMFVGIDSLTGLNHHLNKCYIDHMVTRYRIINRTITDDVTNNYSQNIYQYTDPKTNENNGEEISWILTQSPRQINKEQEFRGHSNTSITDLTRNLRTDINFYQTDDLQGFPWKIALYDISDEQNVKLSETELHYLSSRYRGYDNTPVCAYDPTSNCYEDNLTYYWVRKDWETQKTYTNDGSNFMGTKQEFGYDEYGNVINTTTYEWDGSNWIAKLLNIVGYEPNVDLANSTYLVGLPTYASSYACPGGTCSTDISNLMQFSCSMYDPATDSPTICGINSDGSVTEVKPANGLIKGSRKLLNFENNNFANPQYLDNLKDYDSWGNVISSTSFSDPGTNTYFAITGAQTASNTYDSIFHSRLESQTVPLTDTTTATTTYNYDSADLCYWFGLPTSMTDVNGNVTSEVCDEFGRITEVRQPGDEYPQIATTSALYTAYVDETHPASILITNKLDDTRTISSIQYASGLGSVIQTQNLDGYIDSSNNHFDLVTSVLYDDVGRVIQSEMTPYHNPVGNRGYLQRTPEIYTETVYDPLGRVQEVIYPNQTSLINSYDVVSENGTLYLKHTFENQNRSSEQYEYFDVFGRVVEISNDVDNLRIKYLYDEVNNLIETQQPKDANNWLITSIGYDYAGRKTSILDPDMGYWAYTYDATGNLTGQLDANNVLTCMWYDNAGRVIGKQFIPNGTDCGAKPIDSQTTPNYAFFHYDETSGINGIGKLTSSFNQVMSTRYQYDALGQVLHVSMDHAIIPEMPDYDISYSYLSNGAQESITYPDGEILTYSYDYRGLPERVNSSIHGDILGGSALGDPVYDDLGRPEEIPIKGINISYGYYSPTQQGKMRMQTLTAGTLLDYGFTYDNNGNVDSIEDDIGGDQNFTFDGLDRLLTASADNGVASDYIKGFTYDPYTGNFSLQSTNSTSINPSYDTNHPHAVSTHGNNLYDYDDNGNMTLRTEDGIAYTQTWNAYNMLRRVEWIDTNDADHLVTFGYDADGTRVVKIHKIINGSDVTELTTIYISGLYELTYDTSAQDYSNYFAELN